MQIRPLPAARRRRRLALRAGAAAIVAVTAMVAAASAVAAEPTFVNGESQPVFSSSSADWVNSDLYVESAIDSDFDGLADLVHVDVSRVRETDSNGLKVPVVLEVSPYYAGTAVVTTNWPVDHEIGEPPTTKPPMFATLRAPTTTISTAQESTWVPRGFAVMHAESVGTGQSEGCPTSGGRNETLGAKAVIDWIRGRAKGFTDTTRTTQVTAYWSNGKAGMIGTSYNGTIPNAVATTGVEGLDAIIPISAISNWYDYYRANGMVRAPGGFQGEDLDVLADYVYSRADRLICQPVIDNLRANQDRRTGDYSPFWAERDYMPDVGNVHAAVLVAHGINDWNVMTKHAVQFYEAVKALGVPHQFYFHQGGHGGAPPLTRMNRWFTRYLWGVQNNVESDPKSWVVREGGSSSNPTPYPEWPDPAAADATLRFTPGGSAIGGLTFRAGGAATETLTDDASQNASTYANAASSPNRLVYETPVLTAPIRISGTPSLSLRMAFSKPKANLTALLVNYPGAGGAGSIITRGWIDPENRTAPDLTEPVTPGATYRVTFDLQPKDWVVAAGRRLGVVILSSDREYTIRPAAGTQLSFALGGSSVTLPVVGGARTLAQATGVTAPTIAYTLDPAAPSGDNGWYTAGVSLAWQVADNGAEVEQTGCADEVFSTDGEFTRSCTASNVVGSAEPASVVVKRDGTAPAVSVTRVADGVTYVLGTTPSAGCNTTDATSGVAQPASLSTQGGPTVGAFTATCTGGRDVAGNVNATPAVARYDVIFPFAGFFQPVDNAPTLNVVKAGSGVPVKFGLGGNRGLAIFAAGYPQSQTVTCDTQAPTSAIGDKETVAVNGSSLTYNAQTDQYTYNWKTDKSWQSGCRRLSLKLTDNTVRSALFKFTR